VSEPAADFDEPMMSLFDVWPAAAQPPGASSQVSLEGPALVGEAEPLQYIDLRTPRSAPTSEPASEPPAVEPPASVEPPPSLKPPPLKPPAPTPQMPTPSRRARVVSGRGVTGRGVVVLILVVTAVVGISEIALSGHRGHFFGIAFVVSSAAGALVVRRRDLRVAMIAPPLLYCVLIALISLVDTSGGAGGLVDREAVYLADAFVTGAPTIWIGSVAAALIGVYRLRAKHQLPAPEVT
jgi:hypothetical protein